MKIVYASTDKNDAELYAKRLEEIAKSVNKTIETEVKKEGDRYVVYSNAKIVTRLDVVYIK